MGISLVILIIAGILRFWNLNALPIFADESIYIRWSQIMRAETSLRFLPLSDGKQPLYMWATIPLFKIFSDPLVAGRVLSGFSGLGAVIGVVVAAHILFKNRRISLIAGIIYAVLPYTVFFSRMALADSLLVMFVIWAFNLFSLAVRYARFDLAMVSGFALGFAWLTKSPALFIIMLLPIIFLLNPKKIFVSCILYLVACAIAFGMYNILRLGPEFHMIAIRNLDYIYPLFEVIRHPLDPLIPHLKDSFGFYLYLVTPIGLLFSLWGIADGHRSHIRQRLILSSFFLIPIITQSFIAKAFTARYILFTVPFAVILMAHAVEHIGQKTNKHILTLISASLIIIPSIFIDYLLITSPESAPLPRIERAGYLEEWTAGYGLRNISSQLANYSKSGPVLVGSEGYFGTPFSALQAYLNPYPNIRVIGVGAWIDSVDEKLSNSLSDNQVFLVVNSSRFHVDEPEKIGLKLLASYPKAIRPDGTREFTLFFRVEPK